MGALWIFCYFMKPGTPRGREDKEWLMTFSLMMIILFTALHALAYLPSLVFGGAGEVWGAARGRVAHAYANWRDYQYCAALIVMVVVLYPVILFFSLMLDGFNPYDDLTAQEEKLEGGMQAQIVYLFRIILHMFLIVASIYVFLMLVTLGVIR